MRNGAIIAATILATLCAIKLCITSQNPHAEKTRYLDVIHRYPRKPFLKSKLTANPDFQLAKSESLDFFENIRSSDWKLLKKRVSEDTLFYWPERPIPPRVMSAAEIRNWYMSNAEPNFTCPHERRIGETGSLGDGAKWICDPHRIPPQIQHRQKNGDNGCLIYSVGSVGNFMFEQGLDNYIEGEDCEIHVFDITDYSAMAPPNVNFHHWGFAPNSKENYIVRGAGGNQDVPLKTFQETVELLGHEGKVVDIFKIDCEGCEWVTYMDWLEAPITLNQILVEVHWQPKIDFFVSMKNANYVTFHKEANLAGTSQAVEYAFLRLSPSFFTF